MCRSVETNDVDVAQKIFTPKICVGEIISSVDLSEKNGISIFSILPMVSATGPCKWNFSVSRAFFTDEFAQILAKLLVLDKNV